MNARREIRRLAMQTLYQIDARGEADEARARRIAREVWQAQTADEPGDRTAAPLPLQDEQLDEAAAMALAAWAGRDLADAVAAELAPGWPASRQPAVDRAILRLSHYEMTSGQTPPKVVINEAVELAKRFSTERSPAFVNGVLDKMYRRMRNA